MKTKTLPAKDARRAHLSNCPNFSRSGSIAGMKRQFYGADAKLIRCGAWIYHAVTPSAQFIYDRLP